MQYPFGNDPPPAPTAADIGTLITEIEQGRLTGREGLRVALALFDYGAYVVYGPAGPGPAPPIPPFPKPASAISMRARCSEAAGYLKLSAGDVAAIPWAQLLPLILDLLKLFGGG